MAEEMSAEKIFSQELGKANPDFDKLVKLLDEHPGLMNSDRLVEKIFPRPKDPQKITKKSQKGRLNGTPGNIRISKMMNALRNAKKLKDAGKLSEADYNKFVNAKDPKTGETFATLTAKHAVIAYDKASIDRSPKENLSPAGRAVFAKKAERYAAALAEMQELGVSMEGVDKRGLDVAAIAAKGKVKNKDGFSPALVEGKPDEKTSETRIVDLPAVIRQETGLARVEPQETALARVEPQETGLVKMPEQNPVNVQVAEKEEELEVGNKKPALNIKTQDKPLNVNVQTPQKNGDNENEATVEDAPEKDKGKTGDWDPERIREQDIIDYMYNEWFLAGLSWSINFVGKHLYNGVANLCDKGLDSWKGKKLKKHEIQAKDFSNSADQLLKKGDEWKKEFNDELDRHGEQLSKINKDIRNNLGKQPQQWETLNPEDIHDAQLIKFVNDSYAANPKEFTDKMQLLSNFKGSPAEEMAKNVYATAVNMAIVQYLHDQMNNSSDKLTDIKPEKLNKIIRKLAKRNYVSILKGATAINRRTQQEARKNGITDPKIIAENSTKAGYEFIDQIQAKTNAARLALKTDLERGSYKLNGEKSQVETKSAVNKMTELVEQGEKLWKLNRTDHEIKGENSSEPMGVDAVARSFNTSAVIEEKISVNLKNELESLSADIDANKKRKGNFRETLDRIKHPQKSKNIENNADLSQIINKFCTRTH